MTSHLENEIAELAEMLLTMGSHTEANVRNAVRALVERDDALARAVIDSDAIVDRLEIEIDERVILLLAKAMLATDLRLVTVAMKLSHDLERAADEATTIARRAILLNAEPASGLAGDFPRLAGMAQGMLKEALDAFTNRRPENARAIVLRDEQADALHREIQRDLTASLLEQRGSVSACLNLMVAAKCLERIADQAVSVAEEVVYLCEAQDIRHAGKGTRPESG